MPKFGWKHHRRCMGEHAVQLNNYFERISLYIHMNRIYINESRKTKTREPRPTGSLDRLAGWLVTGHARIHHSWIARGANIKATGSSSLGSTRIFSLLDIISLILFSLSCSHLNAWIPSWTLVRLLLVLTIQLQTSSSCRKRRIILLSLTPFLAMSKQCPIDVS